MRRLKRETFDLVFLDWQVAEISGLQVLQWIIAHLAPPPPVIMLTSRAAEQDVVQALNMGAAEYVSKPFRQAELLARLGNVIRRYTQDNVVNEAPLAFGYVRFNGQEGLVTVNDEPIPLTLREFNLALLLFKNQGRPLSRS